MRKINKQGFLLYDNSIKHIFIEKPQILARIVYGIIGGDENLLSKVKVLNTGTVKRNLSEKGLHKDILLDMDEKMFLNIEANKDDFDEDKLFRNFIYFLRIIEGYYFDMHKRKKNGEEILERPRIVQVNLNSGRPYENVDFANFQLLNKGINRVLIDNLEIWLIDVELCYKMVYNGCKVTKMHYLAAIFYAKNLKEINFLLKMGGIEETYRKDLINMIEKKSEDLNFMSNIEMEENFEDRLKIKYVTGKAEGRAEGREEGREEGRTEGHSAGIIEARENMVKEMMNEGLNYDLISKISGLSKDRLMELNEYNGKEKVATGR